MQQGTQVVHEGYGYGVVISSEGNSITVAFNSGTQTVNKATLKESLNS